MQPKPMTKVEALNFLSPMTRSDGFITRDDAIRILGDDRFNRLLAYPNCGRPDEDLFRDSAVLYYLGSPNPGSDQYRSEDLDRPVTLF